MIKLKKIDSISHKEMMKRWHEREGTREEWQKLAKEKGFDDWESWRKSYLEKFDLLEKEWAEYDIPYEKLVDFFVGPYKGWKQFYEDRDKSRFSDICDKLVDHNKVKDILANPPKNSEFIGVTDNERYMLIEGHHRVAAIALAIKKGVNLGINSTIDLAKITKEEFDRLLNLE